jgi:cysteine desulfurase
VLTASFLYVDGQVLMDALARHGLYIGSGSACVASRLEPSHVLAAMGRLSHGNIRLALAHGTRESDIDRLTTLLPGTVATIRSEHGMA